MTAHNERIFLIVIMGGREKMFLPMKNFMLNST